MSGEGLRRWAPDSWSDEDIAYRALVDIMTDFDVDDDTAEEIVQAALDRGLLLTLGDET